MSIYTHTFDLNVQGKVESTKQGRLIGAFDVMPMAEGRDNLIVLYNGSEIGYTKGKYYISDGTSWSLAANNPEKSSRYGSSLRLNPADGRISLLDQNGVELSAVDTTLERIVKSGRYDEATNELVLVLDDNSEIRIDASKLVDVYSGDDTTIVESGHRFSISPAMMTTIGNKAEDSAVVHKSGDTMTGALTTAMHGWVGRYFKSLDYDATNPSISDERTLNLCAYDMNGKLTSSLITINAVNFMRTYLSSYAYKSDGTQVMSLIDVYAHRDGNRYVSVPSWSVGTNSNDDKILTIKMANSLPSLVHTTGNETITGEKTFSNGLSINIPIEAGASGAGIYKNIQFVDNGKTRRAQIRSMVGNVQTQLALTSFKFDGSTGAELSLFTPESGNPYATAPVTIDTNPDNTIVTKKWSLDKFVAKAGDTMTGALQISNDKVPTLILKNTISEIGTKGYGSADLSMYDKNNNRFGVLSGYVHSSSFFSCLNLRAQSKNSDGNDISTILNIVAYPDGTKYISGVTPSSPSENSTKIPTTAWVNGATTLVHTTGNEDISGTKTFKAVTTYSKASDRDCSAHTGNGNGWGFAVQDKNGSMISCFFNELTPSYSATCMYALNYDESGTKISSSIKCISKTDGTKYGTAPATADSHPDNAIVTKGYLQSTIEQASFSKQPYVVAFDPAVAVTNPTTCIKYQGHCASYVKPVMSNDVLNKGSWTNNEALLKRMQYCTFRADGTIKEVLYKDDLTKVWVKNYADGTPDTPLYPNKDLMEYCATLDQPSSVPSDATDSSIRTLDTMLVIPTLYTYGDERGFRISYDPSQGDAEAHTVDGHVYNYLAIGVYLASSPDGTTLMSVSDAEPLRTTSRYNFRAKLVTKDESHGKWKMFSYYDSRLLRLLTYMVGGSLNSQAVFGNGLITQMGIEASGKTDKWERNYTTYTGKTNKVGMFGQSDAFTQKYDADNYGKYDNGNTAAVRQVRCFVEAPWAQLWIFSDDACNQPSTGRFFAGRNSAKTIQATDDNNGAFFTAQVADPSLMDHVCTFVDTDGLPGMAANPNGAVSSIPNMDNLAWGMPVNKLGSTSTGLCDAWFIMPRTTMDVRNALVGGSASRGASVGVSIWHGHDALSGASLNIGARSAFVFD